MHDFSVFVGQISTRPHSRIAAQLAALGEMAENCGWIDLSWHQLDVGCPGASENVVNLRFCGSCSPT